MIVGLKWEKMNIELRPLSYGVDHLYVDSRLKAEIRLIRGFLFAYESFGKLIHSDTMLDDYGYYSKELYDKFIDKDVKYV